VRLGSLGWARVGAVPVLRWPRALGVARRGRRAGQVVIEETRLISASAIRPDEGYWSLRFDVQLNHVSGGPLVMGSPTARGRPDAGYSGLFCAGRGPSRVAGF
jgi:hypothetical protein